MVGTVSCSLGGVPVLFLLGSSGTWEVVHDEAPADRLAEVLGDLFMIVEASGDRVPGPKVVKQAAEVLSGTAFLPS